MTEVNKTRGCLLGMAIGDAYGAPTEFLQVDEILKRWPPNGPEKPLGMRRSSQYMLVEDLEALKSFTSTNQPIRVTDDTQMAISVGKALTQCLHKGTIDQAGLEKTLREEFVEWYLSPENNRAPGNTCMGSCQGLLSKLPWMEATSPNSKGCGANMRVAPVGLLVTEKHVPDQKTRAAIAQFQSAMTHAHPTALAASDLTAYAVTQFSKGVSPKDILDVLFAYAESQKGVYHVEWLDTLWQRPGVESPMHFIARGWEDCLYVLERVRSSLVQPNREKDPCRFTGAGWIADEAFATGLLCFLLYSDEPTKALQRAAVTSGDSDSIACLTGAFAGAYYGEEVWPQDWREAIEYRDVLLELAEGLAD